MHHANAYHAAPLSIIMRIKWLALMLALTITLSGCSDGDEPAGNDGSGDDSDGQGAEGSGTEDPGDNPEDDSGDDEANGGPQPEAFIPRRVNLTADTLEGFAPLDVVFNGTGAGDLANATYRLAHGDGTHQSGNGSDLPVMLSHTYDVGGSFDAVFELTFHNETLSSNLTITVNVEDVASAPDVLHFEYGESLGCFWDLATVGGGPALPCITQEAGPSGPNVDGFWQALDERYWNLEFTSTVDHGTGACSSDADWPACDSDCFFYADDTTFGEEIGDGNNGGGACAGLVPEGTAWLYIFPYGGPSLGMTLDFTV